MWSKNLAILIIVLWITACSTASPTATAVPSSAGPATPQPTDTGTVRIPPSPSQSVGVPDSPATSVPSSTYADPFLCFTVEVPTDWKIDGMKGGFASFSVPDGLPSFNVSNVSLKNPNLPEALANLRRGSLGSVIRDVRDITISNEPASLVTFNPGTEFTVVAIVIRPECHGGPGALFLASRNADEAQFESFLRRVELLK